jgi:hypothetical protein
MNGKEINVIWTTTTDNMSITGRNVVSIQESTGSDVPMKGSLVGYDSAITYSGDVSIFDPIAYRVNEREKRKQNGDNFITSQLQNP